MLNQYKKPGWSELFPGWLIFLEQSWLKHYLWKKNKLMCRELIITLCLLSSCCFAQTGLFRGFLYEQNSRLPIQNAHIRIKDTDKGTVTDRDGSFNIQFEFLPLILEFSCMGYEPLTLEISKIQKSPIILFLKTKTYDLNVVTISDKSVITLYKDEDYSVLDYHFLGDNLMLLVFRYQLRRSELVLMTTDGDTLSVVPTPAVPPLGLYKDVLSNLHFITKKNDAYQCIYLPPQGKLEFPYHTTYDTILRFLGGYRFFMKNRLYFLEHSSRGFMTSFGYYSRDEGRKYAHRSADYQGMRTFYTDAVNYHTFRPIPDPIDENERRSVDAEAITPLIFTRNKRRDGWLPSPRHSSVMTSGSGIKPFFRMKLLKISTLFISPAD